MDPLQPHPYLAGNFAPIDRELSLTPCRYRGQVPKELEGGQYVRNGGNPALNSDQSRDAHWFDGDGMLSGVLFRRTKAGVQPEFVNQYVYTDVYLAGKTAQVQHPIPPSMTTMVNPAASLLRVILGVMRTILLVLYSHINTVSQSIRKLSTGNTAMVYHDGRALATCQSGPPMRVTLPELETVGWFNGVYAEGEHDIDDRFEKLGGDSALSFLKDWTTAHPRVDPFTEDLVLFSAIFTAPFVTYSIIPGRHSSMRLTNVPVPGVSSPRMMHDFGVSFTHSVIMDLPLSLDPFNLARSKPVVEYNPKAPSRFGVFPRWDPSQIHWFETKACCIFHTANTWDEISEKTIAVNMLVCRLTSASLVYSAGGIIAPVHDFEQEEEEQSRLYYYRFDLTTNTITHQFALSAIPFEFPSVRDSHSMSDARFIYGCSSSDVSFGAALGRAVKINRLAKFDTKALIERGKMTSPTPITGCVDMRSVDEIVNTDDPADAIRIFSLPTGCYAQEPRFVPRENSRSEDDGFLLTYVFDESQLLPDGSAPESARSELWVIDAFDMKTIVARIELPQRVPYGLHGAWFPEHQILRQRPVASTRDLPTAKPDMTQTSRWRGWVGQACLGLALWIEKRF